MTPAAERPTEGAAQQDAWGEPRSRTVSWWDPSIGARAMLDLSGREYLQAMIDGRLPPPPISGLMAMTAVSVGEGTVEFRCSPDESAYNPIGVVHGGLVCTLLDSVAGCAVHSTLPAGMGYTSLEIKVSYLRPVRHGEGELTATGRVTKPGRRAAFVEGEVRDERGRLVATASSTCLVFPLAAE
jgi:uncharacterized protein (TIGR00369 family)